MACTPYKFKSLIPALIFKMISLGLATTKSPCCKEFKSLVVFPVPAGPLTPLIYLILFSSTFVDNTSSKYTNYLTSEP